MASNKLALLKGGKGILPPTPRQIDSLRLHLKNALFIEMAAVLSQISPNDLLEWFRRALAGDPDFTPVLDMYLEETALLAKAVMAPIFKKAFEDKDMEALKFIYNNRIKRHESRFLDKLERQEDERAAALAEGAHGFTLTAEQVTEAEKRQLSRRPGDPLLPKDRLS
jgi:hypothetical protein